MNWTTLFKKFANGKYIVGLLAIPFIIFGGFSSAYIYSSPVSISCNGGSCPSVTAPNDAKGIKFDSFPNGCYYLTYSCGSDEINYYATQAGEDIQFNECTRTKKLNLFCGVNNGTVNIKYFYPQPPLISGGTNNFTPIITRLINITREFIPYMIYIVIACLGVTLAFKALKYIIGYIQNKSKGAVRGK